MKPSPMLAPAGGSPAEGAADGQGTPVTRLRLYVAGQSPNSVRALANIQAICQEFLADSSQLEIVDVLTEPFRALADQVFVTPTLLKLAPPPMVWILGSLDDRDRVLSSLGLDGRRSGSSPGGQE